MEVVLASKVPIFEHLANLATEFAAKERPLRLVGGMAMLLWRRHLSEPLGMTRDLDCVLLKSDLANEDEARATCAELLSILDGLGFARMANWRPSRSGRFGYSHSADKVDIEFLSGTLSIGRKSRREPAWRVVELREGDFTFYTACVPWIDLVSNWIEVQVQCGSQSFVVLVPDITGLAALKLKAVGDKLERIEEEKDASQLESEKLRLTRHATDCGQLLTWLDQRGEFDQLMTLISKQLEVRVQARRITSWMFDHPGEVAELELSGLKDQILRLT